MINLYEGGAYLVNGTELIPDSAEALREVESKTAKKITKEEAIIQTICIFLKKSCEIA